MANNLNSLYNIARTIIGVINNSPIGDDSKLNVRLVAELVKNKLTRIHQEYIEAHKYEPIDTTLLTPICLSLEERNKSLCPPVISCETVFAAKLPKFLTRLNVPIITFVGHPDTRTSFIQGDRPVKDNATTTRFKNSNSYYYKIIGDTIYIDRPKKSLLCTALIIGIPADPTTTNPDCIEFTPYPTRQEFIDIAINEIIRIYQATPIDITNNDQPN